jgi:hypothetical protein
VLNGKINLIPNKCRWAFYQKVHSLVDTQPPAMAITILAPTPAGVPYPTANSSDSEDGGADLEGDLDMRPSKRARRQKDIVTPGEIVTDDPQWMRYAAPYLKTLQKIPTNNVLEATAHSSRLPLQKS